MTASGLKKQGQGGFSLLEVIVTIIVASILGAMLVQFMGTSITQSTAPLLMAQEGFSLNHVMESINVDYRRLSLEDETPLATLRGYIQNGNVSGNVPYYGLPYTEQTQWIAFSGGDEVADTSGDNNVLKVTVSFRDQSLTALFTK